MLIVVVNALTYGMFISVFVQTCCFLDQMFKYASVNHPVIYGDTICI